MGKNLYRLNFKHCGPKSSRSGIICLLLAKNEGQIFEYLESDGYGREGDYIHNGAIEGVDREEEKELYRKEIMSTKGSLYHEDACYEDAFYGCFHSGWELIKENCATDYSELIKAGIVIDISEK